MMSSEIHSTAIVSPKASIGAGVKIGPYSVIGDDVRLGDNVEVKSHVVIEGSTTIGEGTRVFPFASLGLAPQDLKYRGEHSTLEIGKNCTIREHVTMNPGTEGGNMKTVVGDNCLFMVGAHVAHDCVVGDNVIMANNATLAGHVTVGDFAIIGGLSAVHQFVRIGPYAMIGGMSGVEAYVIPFGLVKGERAFLAGLNLVGMERRGLQRDQIKITQKAFSALFSKEGTFDERVERVANEFDNSEQVLKIVQFIRDKTGFPICQPQRKTTSK
jgi:UDP-N-acetylglucosamine acyltransferase